MHSEESNLGNAGSLHCMEVKMDGDRKKATPNELEALNNVIKSAWDCRKLFSYIFVDLALEVERAVPYVTHIATPTGPRANQLI